MFRYDTISRVFVVSQTCIFFFLTSKTAAALALCVEDRFQGPLQFLFGGRQALCGSAFAALQRRLGLRDLSREKEYEVSKRQSLSLS